MSTERASLPSTDDPSSWIDEFFKPGKHHKHDGTPVPPNGGDGCFEIDTVLQEGGNAFYAATAEGQTFVGEDEGPETNIYWRNLSGEPGYPGNACGVSIDVQDPDINVDIITTEGEVFGIVCTREMGDEIGDCGSWTDRGADLP